MPTASASLLSTTRREWCEKDLCAELGSCHPRTVKRWWKKLRCPPDKRRGGRGAMHLWTQRGAERLYQAWRAWHAMRGFDPIIQLRKFTGLPVADNNQLIFDFEDRHRKQRSGRRL